MPPVWTIVGSLGHAVAALLFATLAILISRRAGRQVAQQLLVVALALTALWSLRHALGGALTGATLSDGISETMRNAAWLAVVWACLRDMPAGKTSRIGRPAVVAALALLLCAQVGFDLLVGEGARISGSLVTLERASWLLRCTFALGALVLLHGLSTRRDHPGKAGSEVWIAAALAFMWAYDFNHYMLAWTTHDASAVTGPMRGFVVALLTIPLGVALRANDERRMALSRTLVVRLVSGGVILLYLVSVLLLVTLTGRMAAPFGRVVQLGLLFGLAVAVLALLPSAALRSWLRVEITKHFFSHRYDYRAVWLGFAATVGRTGMAKGPLGERLTRAIAEVVQSRAALMFLRDSGDNLVRAHEWQWPKDTPTIESLDAGIIERLESSGWILDISADWERHQALLPAWMEHDTSAWVLAPLIHEGRMVGVILLASPPVARAIDWEDLDVLRVVCGEAASLISEARSREALAEAQRFDEFNRRFAFILHDLKNLVSQISLLASNAERHADNPAFRADMVLTLKETVARMNDLLQRLGRPGTAVPRRLETVDVGTMLRGLLPRWQSGLGPVELVIAGDARVCADRENLERALGHLVKNGLEASNRESSVEVSLIRDGDDAVLQVTDRGSGMTEDFIREELFRPFSSTKSNGFGLGVHEARLIFEGMGGKVHVESTPGTGTNFTIRFPLALEGERLTDEGAGSPAPVSTMQRTG